MALLKTTKSRKGNGEKGVAGATEEVVVGAGDEEVEKSEGTESYRNTKKVVAGAEGVVGSGPGTDLAGNSSKEFTEVTAKKKKRKKPKRKVVKLSVESDTGNSEASCDDEKPPRPPLKSRMERLKDRTGRKEAALTPMPGDVVESEPSTTKTALPQDEGKDENDEVVQVPMGEGGVFSDPMVRMTALVQKDVERLLTHKSNKMSYGIQNENRGNVAKLVVAVMDLQIRNVQLTTEAKCHQVEKKTFAQVAKSNLAQISKVTGTKVGGIKCSGPKVSAPNGPAKPKPKKGSLLVFPKVEVTSAEALKGVLKKTINPTQLKVKVLTLRR